MTMRQLPSRFEQRRHMEMENRLAMLENDTDILEGKLDRIIRILQGILLTGIGAVVTTVIGVLVQVVVRGGGI